MTRIEKRSGDYTVLVGGTVISGTRMTLEEARADERAAKATNAHLLRQSEELLILRDVLLLLGGSVVEVEYFVMPDSNRVDAWLKGDLTVR